MEREAGSLHISLQHTDSYHSDHQAPCDCGVMWWHGNSRPRRDGEREGERGGEKISERREASEEKLIILLCRLHQHNGSIHHHKNGSQTLHGKKNTNQATYFSNITAFTFMSCETVKLKK